MQQTLNASPAFIWSQPCSHIGPTMQLCNICVNTCQSTKAGATFPHDGYETPPTGTGLKMHPLGEADCPEVAQLLLPRPCSSKPLQCYPGKPAVTLSAHVVITFGVVFWSHLVNIASTDVAQAGCMSHARLSQPTGQGITKTSPLVSACSTH
jgi:hypothetical protein